MDHDLGKSAHESSGSQTQLLKISIVRKSGPEYNIESA